MKEDFLHYVWKFQKFEGFDLFTSKNERLHIKTAGGHNLNSGPDFFNAQVELDGQLWAGNIEIHLKSSDWYAHNHESDPAYDNVILHVVWEHDAEIYRKDGATIPTLVLKSIVPKNTLDQYQKLFSKTKKWINCESDFAGVDSFVMDNWVERLYIERLQKKQEILLNELQNTKNHWEAMLFRMLCKNFGLNINGEAFFSLGKSIDFSVIKKCRQDISDLEALFFGQAGFLSGKKEDGYFMILTERYNYLCNKFSIKNDGVIAPQFFRLRPPNFPTIRLAQLAALYHEQDNLFSKIIDIQDMKGFYDLFKVSASEYWNTHYNFGVTSKQSKKRITRTFMDLLAINTLLPIKFCYSYQHGQDASEMIIEIASQIPSERNAIVEKFNSLKPISKNAYQSQALLQLKSEYCDKGRCLQCAIGNSIIAQK